MPTVRATTASALALPCTSAPVTPSRTVLTGAMASPKPSPAASRTTIRRGAVQRVRVPRRHDDEGDRGQRHPARGDQPRGDDRGTASRRRPRRPGRRRAAAAAPARRPSWSPGRGGVAGEQRDVDQRGDQGDPDQQVDHQRAPGAGRPQRAAAAGPASAVRRSCRTKATAATSGERQQDRAVRDDLGRRVGGGERPHEAAERDDDERRARARRPRGPAAAARAAAGRRRPGAVRLRTTSAAPGDDGDQHQRGRERQRRDDAARRAGRA